MTKRKARVITLPEATDTEEKPPQEPTRALEEAKWLSGADAKNGVYRDPQDPSRFYRRGRGGRPRVQKRVTVYLDELLVRKMDINIANSTQKSNRSQYLEEALRNHLKALASEPVNQ